MSYCIKCGKEILENTKFCKYCGVIQMNELEQKQDDVINVDRKKYKNPHRLIFPDEKKKSTAIAVFLSILVTGLGQIYLGQTSFGIFLLMLGILSAFGTVGVGYVIVWPISIYLAYRDAEILKSGSPIKEWGFSIAKLKK